MDRRVLRSRRRLKGGLIAAGLALTVVLSVVGFVSAALARTAPSWWRQYRPTVALADRGAAIENAAVSHLYRQRPADPAWLEQPGSDPWRSGVWSIALRDADASAWLAARLPAWIEGHADFPEWPRAVGKPQVRFDRGIIRIGVLVRLDDGERILSADFSPEIRPDGSVWLRTHWVRVGRLPIPAGLVLGPAVDGVRDRLPDSIANHPNTANLGKILSGTVPVAEDPVMKLEDGRSVRLVGLRISEGRLELDLRTEAENALAKN